MPPRKAKPFYASLVDRFRNAYSNDEIKGWESGERFGGTVEFLCNVALVGLYCLMATYVNYPRTFDGEKVSFVNDGPVTMQLDPQSSKNSVDAAES